MLTFLGYARIEGNTIWVRQDPVSSGAKIIDRVEVGGAQGDGAQSVRNQVLRIRVEG